MDKIDELLETTIEETIEKYRGIDPGSKEAAVMCDNITKLYHAKLESTKIDNEYAQNVYKSDVDDEKTKAENERQKEESKRKWIEFAINTAKGVGMSLLTLGVWWQMNKAGFLFEQNGIWKSPTFKDVRKQTTPRIKMDN